MRTKSGQKMTPYLITGLGNSPIMLIMASNKTQAAAMVVESIKSFEFLDEGDIERLMDDGWPSVEHIREVDTSRRHALLIG